MIRLESDGDIAILSLDRAERHNDVTVRPWYATVGFSPDGGWTALLPDVIERFLGRKLP